MLTLSKLPILGLALFSVVSAIGRANDEKTPQSTAAQHYIAPLSDGKFKDAEDQSDAAMQQALPADKLQAIWQMLTQTSGTLKQQRVGHVQTVKDYQVVDMVCQFEKAELIVRVSLDQNQRVAGLFFLPKEDPNGISLKTKSGTLYGTVDLPAGKGPWPVAIVLAGSGPVDRDGNEPGIKNDCLKMLGQGLAAHEIAVLRFDSAALAKAPPQWLVKTICDSMIMSMMPLSGSRECGRTPALLASQLSATAKVRSLACWPHNGPALTPLFHWPERAEASPIYFASN